MNNYGETFRYLRKSKNFTLKEASFNIVSIQALSKFERNKMNISIDIFFKLLNKLNIEISEFLLVHNRKNDIRSEQYKFNNRLFSAKREENIKALKELRAEENSQYRNSNNIRHKHNIIQIDNYINYFHEGSFSNEKNMEIINYLFDMENWGYYELVLYNNCLPFFSFDQNYFLINQAISKGKILNDLVKTRNFSLTILMNFLNYCLNEDKIDASKKTILLIENNFEKDNSFFYEKNRFHFLKGIYYCKIQDFEKGKKHCEFSLEVYRQYGEISKYEEMKKEYNTILKDIELSKS